MAINATSIFEVQSGGSDNNAGGFDPSLAANMLTDGAATSATGTAPVFSSASYNFVAGDVGAWVYIASGTNWVAGWYKISSVASNKATLDAASGHAILSNLTQSIANGCATVASPSGATWAIDYSQSTTAVYTASNLAAASGSTTVTSTGASFGKQMVGNSLQIRSGTNFAAGWYFITNVTNATSIVVDRDPHNTVGAASGGTGNVGGCLATPGKAGAAHVGGNTIFIQSGSYSVTSASTNVAGGCVAPVAGVTANTTRVVGYGTYRLDYSTQPTLTASGISTFKMVTFPSGGNVTLENVILDAASLTSGRCIDATASSAQTGLIYRCTLKNAKNNAINGFANVWAILCGITGCPGGAGAAVQGVSCLACVAYTNTTTAFALNQAGSVCIGCLAVNNTSAAHGFNLSQSSGFSACINCTSYANTGDGFHVGSADLMFLCVNCISENNTAYGFNATAATMGAIALLCGGYNNTTALFNNWGPQIGTITATGEIFTNAGGNDFSLNNNVGAGALFRAAALPGAAAPYLLPGLSTNAYPDCGAVQHKDNSGSSSSGPYAFIG